MTRPQLRRRIAAVVSLVVMAAVLIATVLSALRSPGRFIAVLVLLVGLGSAVWFALTRAGGKRVAASALAVAAVAAVLAIVIAAPGWWLMVRIVPSVAAVLLAQYALSRDTSTLKRSVTAGTPVPAAQRGVLIMN